MAEYIFVPSVPHLQVKTFRHKLHHVEPIMVPNFPKGIHDKYYNFTLWCDLINIDRIGFLNNLSRHIMFDTLSMI